MTYRDFAELSTYFSIQPFGVVRDDLHAARVQCSVADGFQALLYSERKVRTKKAFSPKDFMLKRKKSKAQNERHFFNYLKSEASKNERKKPSEVGRKT